MKIEHLVLGRMFRSENFKHTALAALRAYDFKEKKDYATIFSTIRAFTKEEKSCDILLVFQFLLHKVDQTLVCDLCGVDECVTDFEANQVLRAMLERNNMALLNGFAEELQQLTSGGHTVAETLAEMDQAMDLVKPFSGGEDAQPIKNLTEAYLDRKMAQRAQGKEIKGIPTGFTWLDRKLSGLNKGNLITLAADTSFGKSAFLQHICLNISGAGHNTILFTIEMPREEVLDRMVANIALLDHTRIRAATLTQEEVGRMINALSYIDELPLWIDDATECGCDHIKRMCRKVKNTCGEIEFVGVDLLQKMELERGEKENLKLANTTKRLEKIAKQGNFPLMLLSHVNRSADEDTPRTGRLLGSSMIGGDSNTVMFLSALDIKDTWRWLTITKNRGGETGATRLEFAGKYMRFGKIQAKREEEQ